MRAMEKTVALSLIIVLIIMVVFLGNRERAARSQFQAQLGNAIANNAELMRQRDACVAN